MHDGCTGGTSDGQLVDGRVIWWVYAQFLFRTVLFKEYPPPGFEVFRTFCFEDGLSTFPSTELNGVADWWNPANAFGDPGPVGKNPNLGEDGS